MQNLPMYFPKTALSTSSDVISGIQFKFLGVLVLIPTYATNTNYAFTPEVFTFGPSRFSESEVEVDLSAGGAPKLTRTANSTYIHPFVRQSWGYQGAGEDACPLRLSYGSGGDHASLPYDLWYLLSYGRQSV